MKNIVQKLTRPPRQQYHPHRLNSFCSSFSRTDSILLNDRKQRLQISFYDFRSADSSCCLLYLHSNNGSKLEGLSQMNDLLKLGLNVCLFDFSGCGNSEGDYITLGINQSQDISCVVNYLQSEWHVRSLVLWGRSMGAVSAIKYCSKSIFPIKGLILDTPFCNLQQVIEKQINQRSAILGFVFPIVRWAIDSQFNDKTGHSLDQLNLEETIKNTIFQNIPAIFIASKKDQIVDCSQVQTLFTQCPSKLKKLLYIQQQHEDTRSQQTYSSILCFIRKGFKNQKLQSSGISTVCSTKSQSFYKLLNQKPFNKKQKNCFKEYPSCSWNCYK